MNEAQSAPKPEGLAALGSTTMPIGMNTYTTSAKPICEHRNGWYVVVNFWIFSKRIFVCTDCGASRERKWDEP